jgi:LacI family transcriptional regulator
MAVRTKARLADVARDAGVSSATASRALAQPELVAAATLARVTASARALGYRPDAAARTLASGRSMTIGAVMPTLYNEIFSRALQSMQSVLAAENYQLLVASHDYNPIAETEAMRMLLARGVDGLMVVGAERTPEGEALIREARVPVVLTWRAPAGQPAVTVDNERAGWLAAQHLIDIGHRRIGMVTGRTTFNDRQKARLAGARACLEQAGLKMPDWLTSQQPTTLAGGRSGAAALLGLAEPPTAMIGGIDLLAIGCIVEAQARGMGVPVDLSVVGIDDLDMSAHLAPSLTTVHIPTARIGAEAATMLLRSIRDKTSPEPIMLPIELVHRRSTRPLSVF